MFNVNILCDNFVCEQICILFVWILSWKNLNFFYSLDMKSISDKNNFISFFELRVDKIFSLIYMRDVFKNNNFLTVVEFWKFFFRCYCISDIYFTIVIEKITLHFRFYYQFFDNSNFICSNNSWNNNNSLFV